MMKLGVQFYSLRQQCRTPEELKNTFRRVSEMGYEVAQMSGICQVDPYVLKSYAEDFALPITCTHSSLDRILNDTDALIREHKIYGADTVGLGWLPSEYCAEEGIALFKSRFSEPMKKIADAGLFFAYHNHAFEFDAQVGGRSFYDALIEEVEELHFIMDTYWVAYAGRDPLAYIRKIGGSRMQNIHYKDLKPGTEKPTICACGDGTLDFAAITAVCEEVGIENVLVEQDNAAEFPCAFAQMARSFRHLDGIVHHE